MFVRLCLALLGCAWLAVAAHAEEAIAPAAFVRTLVFSSPDQISFAQAKLAVDHFVAPSVDVNATLAELDRMAGTVEKMLTTLPPEAATTDMERMNALRAFLYQPGWWNNNQPFAYDLSDPLGRVPGAQMLSRYLFTRKGNCVSMPLLFVALGEKLGLELTLSTAPQHLFVKWTDRATGKTWNLEATSGAGATRDQRYREQLPMTDAALANGVYLKTLSRQEALATIATAVLDGLLAAGRYQEAIATADVLIEAWPANTYAMIQKGNAYQRLLRRDFISRYPRESDIPADRLPKAQRLFRENRAAYAQAEAQGWRETDGQRAR